MERTRTTASNSSSVMDLATIWQKHASQIKTVSFLLPQQQRNLFTRFSRCHQSLTAQPRRFRRRLIRKARRTLSDIAFMLALGIALPAEAATLLVDTNVPDVNPDGLCSLIEAIDNANADTQVHGDCPAGSGADVVQLQSGSVHTITAALSGLPAQGLPAISSELLIEGNGATVHVAAVPVDRVIDVSAAGNLILSDATISGDAGSGTASNSPRIHNAGNLQLSNVSLPLLSNRVAGITNLGTLTADKLRVQGLGRYNVDYDFQNGNGILNEGNMTLANSEVTDHAIYFAAVDYGSVVNRGNMRLEHSSITGNSNDRGGSATAGIGNFGVLYGAALNVSENYVWYGGWNAGLINQSSATLTLTDSRLEQNWGGYSGYGGLYNSGSVDLKSVDLDGNSAVVNNGYMELISGTVLGTTVYNNSDMILDGVTIANNSSSLRSGLINNGNINVNNSTISNNYSRGWPYAPEKTFSGVYNSGNMAISSSTIAGNAVTVDYADDANLGLLNKAGASLSLSQTMVTGQFINNGITTTGRVLTNEGTILNSEHNLFGDSSVTSAEAFVGFAPGPTDVVATSDGNQPTALQDILALRPRFSGYGIEADLKDNGGPTETVALVPGSPAIDAAGTTCVITDQRGVTRPQGPACDIGAFEAPPSFPPVINLSDLDGSAGYTLNGVAADDETGFSVSDAGDINGDGIADLILGAPEANREVGDEERGASYVVFGRDTESDGAFPAVIELSTLDGGNGFVLQGGGTADESGDAVSGPGDINGDGIDDVAIAAPGSVFTSVVFGRDTASDGDFPASIELGPVFLDGDNGFRLEGVGSTAVSAAGDVNNDGLADLLIGSSEAAPNGEDSGESYLVFGRDTATAGNFPAIFALADLDGSNGFSLRGASAEDFSGTAVSGAGDLNHDGVADVVIGAFGADANGDRSGVSYVVFGRDVASEGGFPATIELSALDGSDGFALNGVSAEDFSGTSVSDTGDINGDGIDDVLIGSPGADPNGDRSGASQVVFGRDTATDGDFPATLELSALDGSNGFTLNGEGVGIRERSGFSVSGTDDINDDGIRDVVIGAPGANRSYVVFGRDTAREGNFPATVELSALNGSNGFAVNGVNAGDGAAKVSGAGDINHDGSADVLIGAPGADPNGDRSGAGYVVFGLVSNDMDRDGITDDKDNCILQANGPLAPDAGGFSQRDTDDDGYGNMCDPDFDNSGNVDFADLAYLKSVFFSADVDADLDGDGKVDFADLAIQKSMFFHPPGPSGLVP